MSNISLPLPQLPKEMLLVGSDLDWDRLLKAASCHVDGAASLPQPHEDCTGGGPACNQKRTAEEVPHQCQAVHSVDKIAAAAPGYILRPGIAAIPFKGPAGRAGDAAGTRLVSAPKTPNGQAYHTDSSH